MEEGLFWLVLFAWLSKQSHTGEMCSKLSENDPQVFSAHKEL